MRVTVTAGAFLLLASCGYVGPVLPPSPELPPAITDLTAVERGDQILITFSTPPRTVDNLPIKTFSQVDLRIGPAGTPFDFDRWAAGATRIDVAPPAPNDPDDPQAAQVHETLPVSNWMGKHLTIAVRTAVRSKGHFSSWSNRVVLDAVPPLASPAVKATPTANGILVTWPTPERPLEFRVYRKGPGDNAPVSVGTSQTADYLDTSAQYDTPYEYTVVAAQGLAESLPSRPYPINAADTFAPSVPASITALAAPTSVEVTWERSPESDLKGYLLYRSVNGGAVEKIGGAITLPTYSDRAVEHGKTYRYQVSAIDRKGNESAKSKPTEVAF